MGESDELKELNRIFADNLIFLRKKAEMTQLELAERLNYSDKAVSKWERAEAIPDVSVLMSIADIFGVTIDYLVKEHAEGEKIEMSEDRKQKRGLIVTLITFLAFVAAETVVYLVLANETNRENIFFFCFVYPFPVWAVVSIVFSSLWGNKLTRFLSVSALLVFTTLDVFLIVNFALGTPYYLIFVLLVPALLINYFSFYLSGNFFKKR